MSSEWRDRGEDRMNAIGDVLEFLLLVLGIQAIIGAIVFVGLRLYGAIFGAYS